MIVEIRPLHALNRKADAECNRDITTVIPEYGRDGGISRYYQAGDRFKMQVIYAMPFVLISALAFLVCVVVPRWRRYRFQALLAPVAFGFCSIVTAGAIILTADHFNLGLFTRPWSGLRDAGPLILIYFIPGMIGSWVTVLAVTKIVNRRHS